MSKHLYALRLFFRKVWRILVEISLIGKLKIKIGSFFKKDYLYYNAKMKQFLKIIARRISIFAH